MVDSVRFPPSIGGSGKTFTSDANPQTGVFNGGHRINFFPMLADTVAAAGYVSQYAQAIDGAAANADKAEDAKGYVEAVADAYKVNIWEAYNQQATLSNNFSRGKYLCDTGQLQETITATDILSVQRASPKWVIGPDGLLHEFPIDTIARHWRLGKPQGVLIEEQRTNIIQWSEALDNAYWGKENCEILANASASPRGLLTADKVIETTGNGEHGIRVLSVPVSNGVNHTASAYFKRAYGVRDAVIRQQGVSGVNYTALFSLEDGAVISHNGISAGTEKLGNGWYRCWFTCPSDDDSSIGQVKFSMYNGVSIGYAGDGESALYIWGAQLEAATSASSYIPTTSASATRSADSVYRLLGDEFNAFEGTLFFDFEIEDPKENRFFFSLGSDSERLLVSYYNASFFNFFGTNVSHGGGGRHRVAVSYQEGGKTVTYAINGAVVKTSLTELDVSLAPKLWIGRSHSSQSGAFGMHQGPMFGNAYLPRALTNAELEELTAL